MKIANKRKILALGFLLALVCGSAASSQDARLQQSRDLVKSFGQRLQVELKQGLAEGGPVAAVKICKDKAPQIASELSRLSGASVRRTSLRFRNPGNMPQPWEMTILQRFEAVAGDANADERLEHFGADDNGTQRYMAAIRVGAVCLACHGAPLPAELQEQIDDEYPHDRAVGYELGDIRGAFSVTWPNE